MRVVRDEDVGPVLSQQMLGLDVREVDAVPVAQRQVRHKKYLATTSPRDPGVPHERVEEVREKCSPSPAYSGDEAS